MFIITEKDNKTFIQKKPASFFDKITVALIAVVVVFFLIYKLFTEGPLPVALAILSMVIFIIIVIVIAYRNGPGVILTTFIIDWNKKIIRCELGEGKHEDIPLTGTTINCVIHMSVSPKAHRTYFISFSVSDQSGGFFPLWREDYRDAIPLADYFYKLHQKGLISLDQAGQFLAQNHARPSMFWVYFVQLIWFGAIGAASSHKYTNFEIPVLLSLFIELLLFLPLGLLGLYNFLSTRPSLWKVYKETPQKALFFKDPLITRFQIQLQQMSKKEQRDLKAYMGALDFFCHSPKGVILQKNKMMNYKGVYLSKIAEQLFLKGEEEMIIDYKQGRAIEDMITENLRFGRSFFDFS